MESLMSHWVRGENPHECLIIRLNVCWFSPYGVSRVNWCSNGVISCCVSLIMMSPWCWWFFICCDNHNVLVHDYLIWLRISRNGCKDSWDSLCHYTTTVGYAMVMQLAVLMAIYLLYQRILPLMVNDEMWSCELVNYLW